MHEDAVRAFMDRWQLAIQTDDIASMSELLAPDVEIGAPPAWDRMRGHALVTRILALSVKEVDDFVYQREWINGREIALEFTAKVGDMPLHGIDLITLDADFRVIRLDILMRPLATMNRLTELLTPDVEAFMEQGGA